MHIESWLALLKIFVRSLESWINFIINDHFKAHEVWTQKIIVIIYLKHFYETLKYLNTKLQNIPMSCILSTEGLFEAQKILLHTAF